MKVEMGKVSLFEVVGGTYEEFLLGYNFSSKENELSQSFAAHDHSASIRCVATCGHYLASGGADDRIFIYDLNTRKLHHTLTHHNATVNCIQFTQNHSHIISGSSDGVLAIVRVGNWQLEKIWDKAHKGAAVLDIAVHSSGKLALTLGADNTLCTWNLIKGRQAYIINLKSKCKDSKSLEKLLWAPDGVRFILYGGKFIEIWSIETGGHLKQIEHEEKVTACAWFNNELLLIGHENGEISSVNVESVNDRSTFKAHEARVKSISTFKKRITTVSSNGEIKIWNKNFDEIAVIDTGCRLTCLCIVPPILKLKTEINLNEEESCLESNSNGEKKRKIKKAQVIELVEDSVTEDANNHQKMKNCKNIDISSIVLKKKKKLKH